MYRSLRIAHGRHRFQALGHGGGSTFTLASAPTKATTRRHLATVQSPLVVPELTVPDLDHAKHLDHLRVVDDHLRRSGILRVTLGMPDPSSEYLQLLLDGLHRHQGHQLPITHSAATGWFWDVRPDAVNNSNSNNKSIPNGSTHKARSETMDDFPWHTDCSYEDPPPRFFALQVLQHDCLGGGTLSIMNVARLSARLSPATRAALARPEFEMRVPPEFTKDANRASIVGCLLAPACAVADGSSEYHDIMRFRADIIKPLTRQAEAALEELESELKKSREVGSIFTGESPADTMATVTTLHLASRDMPTGTILLVDNRRWLHARNQIMDPNRHLRRVRWDAVPFS